MILYLKLWVKKLQIRLILGAQTVSAWATVEIEVCSLDFVL